MRVQNLVAAFLGLMGRLSKASPIGSTVHISSGTVQGNQLSSSGINEFLGIPYAAPPIGPLRWKPPQPVTTFRSTKQVTTFGPSCYGFQLNGPSTGPESEDCLTINLWTGAKDTTEKRPVMVWIYGGGFQFGSSSQSRYNGTQFANDGVILVSFNYRLGVFGFLALEELDNEGTNSGNFGLQDQLAALKWVKENIANFGGDPDNVTVFGESAGAHSVGLLVASPLPSGLFHKAILESGAYWESEHGSIETFDNARARGQVFLKKQGAHSIFNLRAISASQIRSATLWNSSTDPAITAFAPSIDKFVIPVAPSVAFDSGKTQKVPILAGFNGDEGAIFFDRALPHGSPLEYENAANILFAGTASRALQLYPGATENQVLASADELIGDLVIRQQTFEALDRQASTCGHACYGYFFTYTSPYSPAAYHTAEISFVFGNLSPNPIFGKGATGPSAADIAMSKTMRTYWTNFARSGNPNGAGLPTWHKYTAGTAGYLELGNNISAIITPFLDRFKYIRSLRSKSLLPSCWRYEFTEN